MARDSGLLRSLKQGRPFPSLAQEVTVGVLHTADVLRRRVGAVIERYGITLQQYNVLRILRGAGSDGLPTLEIAARMIERTPGITRLIDRLERKGLVRRERRAEDRRQVFCRISPEGLRLLARMDQAVNQADEEALGALSRSQQRQLMTLLDAIREEPA